jgi:hypothetical protein
MTEPPQKCSIDGNQRMETMKGNSAVDDGDPPTMRPPARHTARQAFRTTARHAYRDQICGAMAAAAAAYVTRRHHAPVATTPGVKRAHSSAAAAAAWSEGVLHMPRGFEVTDPG